MTTDAVGGVWTYALDLATGLGERGISTTLAIFGPAMTPAQADAANAVPGCRVLDTGAALDWLAPNAADVARSSAVLAEIARATRADLIHLNTPAFAADRRFDVPVVGACHSCLATWWEAAGIGHLLDSFRWRIDLNAKGLRQCTSLIAPTHAFAEATARTYGIDQPRVVHNGRAVARAPGTGRRAQVATAGRLWDAGKNIATLDAAAGIIAAPVLAAGALQGPSGERMALAHAVSLGPLSQNATRRLFAGSLVFASTALYEPFGLGVLEAAQAGCALVLSDIPSFRELWDGVAEFVPATDPVALADALTRLLADPAAAQIAGERAARRALRYSRDAMVDETVRVYAEAMSRPSRPLREEQAA